MTMYVEVLYFKDKKYQGRKYQHYENDNAWVMYKRIIDKMTQQKTECLICLRNNAHELIAVTMP